MTLEINVQTRASGRLNLFGGGGDSHTAEYPSQTLTGPRAARCLLGDLYFL